MDGLVEVSFSSESSVPSPCVDVCKLDNGFVCEGCGRTVEEILKWPEYNDKQKQAVLDRLFDSKG
jgi:predicted Fe-S protein YdhL (DUF1289 family)